MRRTRLVIDSDGGIDDAAAIAWLAARPDIELAAVTAVGGNCPVKQAARNLRVVLEAVGADRVPVFLGADPVSPAPPMARPVMIHGHDGLGDAGLADPRQGPDVETDAVAVLVREMRRGALVLTLGPMTDLALALERDPDAARHAAGLVAMGGSARAGGNARPFAEANVANDPLAAHAVLSAAWSRPPVLVGLDVTHRATLRADEFALLAEGRTPAARLLDRPLHFYRRRAGSFCAPGETPCHDLLAAMTAATLSAGDPIVGTEVVPVSVDTAQGPAWGMTVVDLRVLAWRRADAAAGPAGPADPADPAVGRDDSGALAPDAGAAPEAQADAGTVDGNLEADDAVPVAVALEVDVERFRRELRTLMGA